MFAVSELLIAAILVDLSGRIAVKSF